MAVSNYEFHLVATLHNHIECPYENSLSDCHVVANLQVFFARAMTSRML